MAGKNQMGSLLKKLPELIKLSELLSPETLKSLNTISSIDWDNAALMTGAYDQMLRNMQTIELVVNGLPDIQNVALAQNQVRYVSDIRDSIGLVAGSIENINKVSEDLSYIRAATLLEPMMKEVLELSVKMDAVLDMEQEIDHVNMRLEVVQDQISSVANMNAEAKKSAECAANMLNEIKIREKVIDEKLKRMERVEERMADLSVSVNFVDSDHPAKSVFSKSKSQLTITIPQGKKGDKGDSIRGERGLKGDIGLPGSAVDKGDKGDRGANGRDFSASLYGLKRDLKRFGNRSKGTSLVALDESPTMIYFKISDALDDWTDGQPFGISHGELSINEIAGAVMLLINEKRNQHG